MNNPGAGWWQWERLCVWGEGGTWEISVSSIQFFCESKNAQRIKVYLKKIEDIKRYPIQLLSIRKLVSLY